MDQTFSLYITKASMQSTKKEENIRTSHYNIQLYIKNLYPKTIFREKKTSIKELQYFKKNGNL